MTDHNIFLLTLVFTVIYTSAALLAILLAYRQVRASFDISTREKSLDAYLTFSAKYAELTRMGHEMEVRFHTRDLTLSEYDIKLFFNEFWVLQLQEWEFLQAGILPVRIFTQWMMHSHEYLLSRRVRHYFDADGKPAEISTREGFETYGLRVLRFHPSFIAYLRDLESIPYKPGGSNAYAPIEALTRKYLRGSKYWR
ncbi:MAG: hypothetical protein ACXU8U_00930 [Asticcacaulis sp.]